MSALRRSCCGQEYRQICDDDSFEFTEDGDIVQNSSLGKQ